MSDKSKLRSNVTVDQMIEHMTADLQSSDGQYIQLGFTPPSTPNDSHNWSEYQQMHMQPPNNVYISNYKPTEQQIKYNQLDQTPNTFSNQNLHLNNYIQQQNAMFMPDPNLIYDKHINKNIPVMDMRNGGYILYNTNQNAHQFVSPNQDVSMCGYVYPENREYTMFSPPEIQLQQNQMIQQSMNDKTNVYMQQENAMLQQQQDMMLQQAIQHRREQQNIQQQQQQVQQAPVQNRTQLIENLVGNWVPNTSGTYSPFGNSQSDTSVTSSLFDTGKQSQNNEGLKISQNNAKDLEYLDINLANIKNVNRGVKKQRMVAEVKPMRPSYSDVLAKSAPQNAPPKLSKVEVKDTKTKLSVKKTTKAQKITTNLNLNRQFSSGSDEKDLGVEKNISNSPLHGAKQSVESKNIKNENSFKNIDSDRFSDEYNFESNDFNKSNEFLEKVSSRKNNKNKINAETNNKTKNFDTKNINFSNASPKISVDEEETEFEWKNFEPVNKSSEKSSSKTFKKGKDFKSSSSSYQPRVIERSSEKSNNSAKRTQRVRKRENRTTLGNLQYNIIQHVNQWLKVILQVIIWFLHLISDVLSLSVQLAKDLGSSSWTSLRTHTSDFVKSVGTIIFKVKYFERFIKYIDNKFGGSRFAFWNKGKKEKRNRNKNTSEGKSAKNIGLLDHNIPMPSTGEEAMKRLLACKGKDPYSILGVTPDCTDDDIKRYYKKQAFLVHPDKNAQPGAEEAFKILVHAFDMIGEPERRQNYDRKVVESHQVEQAWSELNDLLSQLHQKMEYAANTIRCTNCTKRHRRVPVDRPCYAARMCAQCKIHHSAREGDIWAESTLFGFLWHYYACMDGAVYDITEWAGCQRANLKHLRANTHSVQYRIVLGRQAVPGAGGGAHRSKHAATKTHEATGEREPDLEEFLNNLYNQSGGRSPNTTSNADGNGNTEAARNRKKNKRKK